MIADMSNRQALPRNPQEISKASTPVSGRLPSILGFGSIGLVILVFVLWSVIVPLASAVIATGTVVVEDNVKTVQHLDGGMVKTILVTDGQDVRQDEPLLILDTSRQSNLLDTLRPQLALVEAEQIRIRAELNDRDVITIPPVSAGISLTEFPSIVSDQVAAFNARRSSLSLKLRSLESERNENEAVLHGLHSQAERLSERISLTNEDVLAADDLVKTGSGTRKAMREVHSLLASLHGDLDGVLARSAELQRRTEHSEIESKRILSDFRETDNADLQRLTAEEQDLMQRINDVSLSLSRSVMRAPVAGQVMNLSVHTLGGVIAPGASILDIVPSGQPLIIEAQIRPVDVDDVVPGSEVMVRAEGAGAQRLPMVAGRVASISADRVNDKLKGIGYFLARIQIDQAKLLIARGVELRPGVSLDVMIAKKKKTLWAYLLDPLLDQISKSMRE